MELCSMRSVLPFVGMVIIMLVQVSNMEVIKAAMSTGMNKYVIIVYSDALSSLIFLLCSILIHRSERPLPTSSILCRFFLLSVFGCSSQIFSYVGIPYSSPTLSAAMLNLIPAFTFMLAILFRMEKLNWKSKSSQAKSLGTLLSIAGAFVVTYYKGRVIMRTLSHCVSPHRLFLSPQLYWTLGAFFLAAEAFLNSAWFILQLGPVLIYKAQEATIGTGFRISLCTWCLSKIGPLYVSLFKPLAIVFSIVMDAIFLGEALHLGSLIGAVIIVAGFYAVMWGKSKEEKTTDDTEVVVNIKLQIKTFSKEDMQVNLTVNNKCRWERPRRKDRTRLPLLDT
ncbi:WAT1-related protein [Melia azedarach]|uniref:WAT1-related protein n=1 Tax=Melia azedarach TaxID=155640 RepID=A0ACC1XKD1_MELAZ|nr:WAT1-related protein [Melia azedarach]